MDRTSWRTGPDRGLTDYLVFEGRADAFAHLVYPQQLAPWTRALTPQQEQAAWAVIQRNLNSASPDAMLALMFGGADNVPRWSGYTIGFNIVQAFLKTHSGAEVEQWTAIEAGELLNQSRYSPDLGMQEP